MSSIKAYLLITLRPHKIHDQMSTQLHERMKVIPHSDRDLPIPNPILDNYCTLHISVFSHRKLMGFAGTVHPIQTAGTCSLFQ